MKKAKGLKGKCQTLHSKIIRNPKKCFKCGYTSNKISDFDCHHLISRVYDKVHCDPRNSVCLCKVGRDKSHDGNGNACHFRVHKWPDEYYQLILDSCGIQVYNEMKELAESKGRVDWHDVWSELTKTAKSLGIKYTAYRPRKK